MQRKRPFFGTLVRTASLLVLVGLPLAARSTHTFASTAAKGPAQLVFDQAVAVSSLDPVNPLGYPSGYEGLFLIGDGLVRFNAKMHPVPDLATKWKVKPNHKTWIFYLRRGVRFQDGSPFTAQSVKADFDRMLDPTADPTQQAIWSNFASVKVMNRYTIAVTTKKRFAATLDYLAHGSAVILKIPSDTKTIGTHPVGTGPYRLASLQPGTSATFVANAHFWGGKPKLAEIVFRAVPNPETRVADLRSGGAQLIDQVPATDLPGLKGDPGVHVETAKTWVTTYLEFNTAHGPLASRLVRQALTHVVDTRGIVKALFHNDADLIASPLAPTMPGYIRVQAAKQSSAAALALLKKAGYTMKGGKLENKSGQMHLTFTAPTGLYPNDAEVAQVIQQEIQSLGVDVTLHTMPAASYFTFIHSATPTNGYGDMYLWAFNPSNGDPNYTLSINFGKPGTDAALWNKSFYNSPRLQKLLSEAAGAVKHSKWLTFIRQAQKQIGAGTPAVWLYSPRNNLAMRKNVVGLTALKVQFLVLRDIHYK